MSEKKLQIALPGAAGKMGQMIASLVKENSNIEICAASEHSESPAIDSVMGGAKISADAHILGIGSSGVIIDFTRPDATMRHVDIALASGTAMVIGTTGLTAAEEEILKKAANQIPIVYCANTSVGVTLLGQIVEQIARQLDAEWDIEIVETHHNQKIDAPSGTALALGRAAAKGRNIDLDAEKESGRDGITGARKSGAIGFAALRGGDVAGEHTVTFFGQQERIEITHRAISRVIFARGALKAARFAASQKPGLYTMDDVLSAS
jgi:4-hydroxy-tetrahydrodipicolinate reductase